MKYLNASCDSDLILKTQIFGDFRKNIVLIKLTEPVAGT